LTDELGFAPGGWYTGSGVDLAEKYEKLWHSRREHLVASQRDTSRPRLPARL